MQFRAKKRRAIWLALLLLLQICAGCQPAGNGEETIVVVPSAPTAAATATPVSTPGPTPTPAATLLPEPAREQVLGRFIIGGDSRGLYADEVGTVRGSLGGVNVELVKEFMQSVTQLEPQPAFMVTLGDYAMGSSAPKDFKEQLQLWLDTAQEFYAASFYYPCYGNHEAKAGKAGVEVFSEVFSAFSADEFFRADVYGRTVYRFDYGACRFFVLNSNSENQPHRISDSVLEWIEQNQGEDYNIIIVHEPAFPSGNHVGRSLDMDPKQRDKFWAVIESLPGVIVFNAHEHQYSRRRVDRSFSTEDIDFKQEVYQVTSAGMGAPFHTKYTDSRGMVVPPRLYYHYVIADVYENRIEFLAQTLDGTVLDRFALHPGISPKSLQQEFFEGISGSSHTE